MAGAAVDARDHLTEAERLLARSKDPDLGDAATFYVLGAAIAHGLCGVLKVALDGPK